MKIKKIKGKAKNCSKEFIRAWIQASASVLAYHNMPVTDAYTIHILPKTHHTMMHNHITGGGNGGWCNWSTHNIGLGDWLVAENMATVILHEMIHAGCGNFGDGTNEKCTSTLTAKLKPTVAVLAQTLLDNTYRNAAFFALTRKTKTGKDMPYRSPEGEEDYYDDEQWFEVHPKDKYNKGVSRA